MKNINIIRLKYSIIVIIILLFNFRANTQKYQKKKNPKKLTEWSPDEFSDSKSIRKKTIKYDLLTYIGGNKKIECGFELNLPPSSIEIDFIADFKSDLNKSIDAQTRILDENFVTLEYSKITGGFFGSGYSNIYVKPEDPPSFNYTNYYKRFDIMLITNFRNYAKDYRKSSYYGFFFDKGLGIECLSFAKNTFTFNGTHTLTIKNLPNGMYYEPGNNFKTYLENVREYTYHFSGPQEIKYQNFNHIIPVLNIGIGWQIVFKKLPLSLETKLSCSYRWNFYEIKPDYYKSWDWNFAIYFGYRF
jgi:hypothetical protein